MRIIATVVAAACLLLAVPSPVFAETNLRPSSEVDLFFGTQALQNGESRTLTFTDNLSIGISCQVIDDGNQYTVIGNVDITKDLLSPRRGRLALGGFGWFNPEGEGTGLPQHIWRFSASSERPILPRNMLIPDIRIQTTAREFIHVVAAGVMLEQFEGYPCVFAMVTRQRPTVPGS